MTARRSIGSPARLRLDASDNVSSSGPMRQRRTMLLAAVATLGLSNVAPAQTFGGGAHGGPPGWPGYDAPSSLVVFGDLLSDDGNAAAVEKSLGLSPSYLTTPYSSTGDFSDGPKWTTDLALSFGLFSPSQQENFAYEGATAGSLGDMFSPVNPTGGLTPLDTFAGQIRLFAKQHGRFSPDDVVSVTFGGNDIFLASQLALAGKANSAQVLADSVNAIVAGLTQLRSLGARHILVSNSPDVSFAPIFLTAEFKASGATPAGVEVLVNEFNGELSTALGAFKTATGLDVKTLDLHTLFDRIVATPAEFGFSDVTQAILSSLPGTGSEPVYNTTIDGRNPLVLQTTLFIDPLFDVTERGQILIAALAHGTIVGGGVQGPWI